MNEKLLLKATNALSEYFKPKSKYTNKSQRFCTASDLVAAPPRHVLKEESSVWEMNAKWDRGQGRRLNLECGFDVYVWYTFTGPTLFY